MPDKLSLTELQLIIRDSLYVALPDMYWVIAEISEIKENFAGHCYLELIEKHPDDKNVRARVRSIIWSNRYRFLKSFFENITGESLREGMKVLVRTKIEYHELYGLSLVISDIDPAFTIGDLAMKRQMVIAKLEQDGVFTMNKEIEFPSVPKRIAVISSKSAAGYSDFIRQLSGNSYGYSFNTVLFEAAMQGEETEKGIIGALDQIAEHFHLFDIVAIIRGGGAQTDLSWFDSYDIAYHITQFPLPVITGIGHDKDSSVTDLVAHMSLKTPTAAADFLIDCFIDADKLLLEISSEFKELSRIIIEENRNRIENSRIKLIPVVRILLTDIKNSLSGTVVKIINLATGYITRLGYVQAYQKSQLVSMVNNNLSSRKFHIEREREKLNTAYVNSIKSTRTKFEGLLTSLNILNPENVLKRGYTITTSRGKIVKKRDQLKKDDIIETQFIDGAISSKIYDPENARSQNQTKK